MTTTAAVEKSSLSIALRPQLYSRVIGQEMPVRLLKAMVAKDSIPRCILLSGPTGVGKTTLARIFAASVNCDDRKADMEPCGACYHCKSILSSKSSIVLEVEAAVHRKVEDMDEVREVVSYIVPEGKRRIIIIDEFHTVSDTAQESLLHLSEAKALDTTFVLTTTRKDSINDAILSRSLKIALGGISPEERVALVTQYFNDFGLKVDSRVLPIIAQAPEGLRSVWQLVDKLKLDFGDKAIDFDTALDVLGLVGGERLEATIAASVKSLLATVERGNRLQKAGVEWSVLLNALFSFAEDSIILFEAGEIRCTSGASEAFLQSTPWEKGRCLTVLNSYHELSRLDWKTGLPKLYAMLHQSHYSVTISDGLPAVAAPIKAPLSLADKLNSDPVWALICRNLGGRVVEAVA